MKRRTFNVISLATVLAPLPRLSLSQQPKPGFPGHQIAEIRDGRLTTAHRGMATTDTAVDDDTLFQAASCSKTVAALAVLTLVRDGRVDLDQPANRHLKRWKLTGPRGATATVAELMSHTAGTSVSGFAGYGPDAALPSLMHILKGRPPANSDVIRTHRRFFGRYRYSGGGYTALQALIEDVTGTEFATYTTQHVLKPAGATRATFDIEPSLPIAHGLYDDGRPLPGGFKRHPESAAAGLWATATDLAKIMQSVVQALHSDQGALLPATLAQRMITPMGGQSGLGLFVYPGPIIAHSGRNDGFDSVMTADLTTGRIRTALTNQNGAIDSFINKVTTN